MRRALVLVALVLAACRGQVEEERTAASVVPTIAPIGPESKKEADDLFAFRCATCHGQTGEGNGPASSGLTPKPRNFHDKTWQASVTDQHIDKIIQYGGAAVGLSPAMPPNPDLVGKPEVVAALREHVRGLSEK